jgi:Domain of unknown function (DUF4265)
MNLGSRRAVHLHPVWRDSSNFVIFAEIDPANTEVDSEQLWARRVDDLRFEMCCIPFFVFDLALGDIVETDQKNRLKRVVTPSGRFTFRVWFGDSSHPRDVVADEIVAFGSLIEWSSENLLAVDAIDRAHAQKIADYLAEHERVGHLKYETGRSK